MAYLGIRFKVSSFMPLSPLGALVDSMTLLPNATKHSFWLGDIAWRFPNFEDVDVFVEKLVRSKLICQDRVIEDVLQGSKADMSQRSLQRRFIKTTGLSQKTIYQIERARKAASLLESGLSIQDTIHELGFTDQPHLSKVLKRFIGHTPVQIARRVAT